MIYDIASIVLVFVASIGLLSISIRDANETHKKICNALKEADKRAKK